MMLSSPSIHYLHWSILRNGGGWHPDMMNYTPASIINIPDTDTRSTCSRSQCSFLGISGSGEVSQFSSIIKFTCLTLEATRTEQGCQKNSILYMVKWPQSSGNNGSDVLYAWNISWFKHQICNWPIQDKTLCMILWLWRLASSQWCQIASWLTVINDYFCQGRIKQQAFWIISTFIPL